MITTKKDKVLMNKFITFDIETMVIDNVHVPYCFCFYDGQQNYSFYLSDYKDYYEMMEDALNNLFRPKYSGYIVYAHNLSSFDGIFLVHILCKMSSDQRSDQRSQDNKINIFPVFKDKSMINIKVKYGKYNINFRDSFLMLPISLEKLAIQFKVDQVKTIFPYNFLNDKYNKNMSDSIQNPKILNYIGEIPNVNYFKGKTLNAKVKNYSDYISDAYQFNNDILNS
jgi:hypothetical protein